ncbi:MAG: FAD-dependent oxidoreductase [Alphaproteobacteria bacterium]|nr:FAD-dependent oxidoreductase [Alphaproteobacteria bacterium]
MTPSPSILPPTAARIVDRADVVIVGGGAAGMCAALAARDGGASVVLLERDATPSGTTALSIGFIPAAGTIGQRKAGIDDSPAAMAADIMAKNKGRADAAMVAHLAREAAPTIDWLIGSHDIPLAFMVKDHYPGHSTPRMHGTPNRTGAELMTALTDAARKAGARVMTGKTVTHLFADSSGKVTGIRAGDIDIATGAVILASGGYAANRTMVAKLMPEIAAAVPFCHAGSQGDAVAWGGELGARLADLDAYQSHGGLSDTGRVPIPWAHILRGGIQVNATGRRFSDESRNYAERALDIVAQPGHFAWSIFDERIHAEMMGYEPYRKLLALGGIIAAPTVEALMDATALPQALADTLRDLTDFAAGRKPDPLGRDFTTNPALVPGYRAVKVVGALYHTQGGLAVDQSGRILKSDGTVFANLFAAGGAARGISGPGSGGYLAGNGLLTATVYGRLAGAAAAHQIRASASAT